MSQPVILSLLDAEIIGRLSPTEEAHIQRQAFDVEIIEFNGDVTAIAMLASDSVDATLKAVSMLYPPCEPRPFGLKVNVKARR